MTDGPNLQIEILLQEYRARRLTPADLITRLLERAETTAAHRIFIHRLSREQMLHHVSALQGHSPDDRPLYGIPFVIKDNLDLAGIPTTAGCPDYAYVPQESAPVVADLLAAGAIPVGKTNLDQFATGLVGTRSPYGACRNSVHREFISGGSSAGSAVAVAMGLASFSLGTDTAGSGRVPAAFNNLIGLKPSLGRLSTRGMVPACRSLDCVSIFSLNAADARRVLEVVDRFDAQDPFARRLADRPLAGRRFGVPASRQLEFFDDAAYATLFQATVTRLEALGFERVEIDLDPFLDTARLLYEGPWIAERFAAVGAFLKAHPGSLHPVTAQVIGGGERFSAAEAFAASYQLKALERRCESILATVDLLMTPTAGTVFTVAQLEADPIRLNSALGYYTNFMNLLNLTGVAVPGGFRADGLPFGVTLVAAHGSERALLALAERLHRALDAPVGASSWRLAAAPAASAAVTAPPADCLPIAVCGAHMRGLALHHQLQARGATFVECTRTAPVYRLYALPGSPARPGLVRVGVGGAALELEVWALPSAQVGGFLAAIPAPLALGKVELASGARVTGFLCEALAAEQAVDITHFGGWRAYLAAQ